MCPYIYLIIIFLLIICFTIIISSYKKESYYNTENDEYPVNNDRLIAGTVYSSYNVAKEDPGISWVL